MARKMKTMDGNTAAAHAAYAFTDVAAIYPITPSSTMAEVADKWATMGRKNIFGYPVKIVEMQSEAGAAGAVHGSLLGGALTSTFTASQGLLLMIPNMYKIAGEKLPGVINVSARCIAPHALSIFGDHSDIYACRQTGFAMLAEASVQEVMDLTPVAYMSAIKGSVPFLNFFDGFRTSHELQKIEMWDYKDLEGLADYDAIDKFRNNALNPEHPTMHGSAENSDIFFQNYEAGNTYYNKLSDIVAENMNKINKLIGTDYKPFNYYGASDASHVIVAMGSVNDTIEETVDKLLENGEKVGVIKVRLYRPFSAKHLLEVLPKSVKTISVLDRTKEPGSIGEPLYLDVVAALKGTEFESVKVFGGRYGLASKDTTPAQIKAVFDNSDKDKFTVGIDDDVTYLSLSVDDSFDTSAQGTTSCKFWGLGADGTVGANKNSIKIIGDNTDMYAQAYFAYDSKKSGGVTISHLRFGKNPIKSTYLISKADFVACHNPSYINKYDIVQDLKPGGTFLLNCSWDDDKLNKYLPGQVKSYIAKNNIQFYTIDGVKIGKEIGLGGRINTVLQSAFFKLSNIIPIDEAKRLMKEAATASYSKKGEKIVKMNHDAIDRGAESVRKVDIPESWKEAQPENLVHSIEGENKNLVDFVNNILMPVNAQKGDDLPVSAFTKYANGQLPQGSAAYEKRGVAVDVPVWNPNNCIQCNFCSYVCPHSVIRPVVLNNEEVNGAPKDFVSTKMIGLDDMQFAVTVSVMDCTGCGSCINVCPGRKGEKALQFESLESQLKKQESFNYGQSLPKKKEVADKFKETTVKGSQFKQPLLEFSGACAGCGETPYAKLVTQLYGDCMYIANATGCSSIWGGSAPSTPYTKNAQGKGPAWANSLFEDNAEFGYGINLAQKSLRARLIEKVEEIEKYSGGNLKEACAKFLESKDSTNQNKADGLRLIEQLEKNRIPQEAICVFKNIKDTCTTFLEGRKPLEQSRTDILESIEKLKNSKIPEELCNIVKNLKEIHVKLLEDKEAKIQSKIDNLKLIEQLGNDINYILKNKDYLTKKSLWIFGGDGWAYDIGYGGLDHVLASGENVNVLVFDTEVYSNTGGQSSKSTPTGAIAQFAAGGKEVKKKDLAGICMSYGYIYVAQIAMGADYNQCLKAITEAEAYEGPSIIIAYAPCINHGIKKGMGKSQTEEKLAVEAGYWNLFRFNPKAKDGKLKVDSKQPNQDYREFLMGEVRYNALSLQNPERAEKLFLKSQNDALYKYEYLKDLEKMYREEAAKN